jgi:hypothetical protein
VDPPGVLALELALDKARLEPITGRKCPVHGYDAQVAGVGRPSTHWRGIFTELPAVVTPVHHLFASPEPCVSEKHTLAAVSTDVGTPQPALPVSYPSTQLSSEQGATENVSYAAFRSMLAAFKDSWPLQHGQQVSQTLLGDRISEVVPSSWHDQTQDTASDNQEHVHSSGSPSRSTEHQRMLPHWATMIGMCCTTTLPAATQDTPLKTI